MNQPIKPSGALPLTNITNQELEILRAYIQDVYERQDPSKEYEIYFTTKTLNGNLSLIGCTVRSYVIPSQFTETWLSYDDLRNL